MNCSPVKYGRLFDLSDIYDINAKLDEMLLLCAYARQMGGIAQNRAQSGKFPLRTIVGPGKTCQFREAFIYRWFWLLLMILVIVSRPLNSALDCTKEIQESNIG